MAHTNCWEFKKCGREPGGMKAGEPEGICPASMAMQYDGVNHGSNAGHYCWEITVSLCTKLPMNTLAQDFIECNACPFFKLVQQQEGDSFSYLLR